FQISIVKKETIVKFQKFFRKSFGMLFLGLLVFSAVAFAQDKKATLVVSQATKNLPVAGANNLYCAGYVQTGKVDTSRKIVGAENEQEQNVYSQGNNVYINLGANKNVQVGDMFAVIRPRGRVETRWTKKDNLGFYVQEVGALEVVKVKNEVAVARVKTSCDNLLLGDLLQPIPARSSPMYTQRPSLDVFGEPSGKTKGRIFMARDGIELLSRDQVVYIDLGSEDGANVGDFLTVYRPLGKGGLFDKVQPESVSAREEGNQSNRFRGGKFSNQAARKKGDEANGKVVTTENAKQDRPVDLRKVVGELVILSVQGKTATAVIVRTAQEMHTGDWVELQ
ncbi:MAG: FlgT C-terminal domain-containing protein, partial [Actinomycetota bacterium]